MAASEDLTVQLAASVSLARANRSTKQLKALYADWQRSELEASKHRHIAAPNAERIRVRAMEAFAECAAVALNLSEDQ